MHHPKEPQKLHCTFILTKPIGWYSHSHFSCAVYVNTAVRASTCFRVLEKWTFPEKSVTSDLCIAGRGCQQANALLCGQLAFNPIIVTRQLLAVQNLVSGNSS